MLVLTSDVLIDLLAPAQVLAAVEAAAIAVAGASAVVPERTHATWQDNTLLTMPALSDAYFGTKVISVVPRNAARGLPVTNGLMVLNDSETGLPLAIMSAAALTAQRTGAVGSLGVKYTTSASIDSLGIVGCGVQGTWQAIFACALRPIREVFCFARSKRRLDLFSATLNRHVPHARVIPCRDARELLECTDLVIAATTSDEPVLPDEPALLSGKHFISVGSFKPSMQELPDSVYRLAGQVMIDSEHARHEVGDVLNVLRREILKDSDIFSVADCITGKRSIDTSRTTAYKTVGMAAYDLFVARAVYEAARSRNLGLEVTLD